MVMDMRGKDVGGQVISLLLAHATRTLKLETVTLNVYPDNIAAIRCYERCAFKFTGRSSKISGAGNEMLWHFS